MNIEEAKKLASQYQQKGNYQQAEQIYRQILKQQPKNVEIIYRLGNNAKQAGRYREAIDYYEQSIALNPASADLYYEMGEAYLNIGELKKAIAAFEKTIGLDNNYIAAYNNLGIIYQQIGTLSQAIKYYKQAIALNPNLAVIYNNLGNCFKEQGKTTEAIKCYKQAIALDPNIAAVYNNLGASYYEQVKLEEARICFEKALAINPNHVGANYNRARLWLLTGNYQQGWQGYEWRWRQQHFPPRNFSQPLWDGSNIEGKTILLHAEQGLGDTIQFIRYAPMVAKLGAKVIVECQPSLVGIIQSVSEITQVVAQGENIPAFDCHAPLLSLPAIFGTRLETIPAEIPYLFPPQLEPVELINFKDTKLKIGIVWASGYQSQPGLFQMYKNKSCPLAMFMELLAIPEISLYSLQVGGDAEDIKLYTSVERLQNLSNQLKDFSATAAAINQLDLVISVDTSVAHLAGALGKPVWVLLPFLPDWRWLLDRDDSPLVSTNALVSSNLPRHLV